jgi:DNA-binding CsgD family transcriptional regulator/tetratricopeptide (TPR) repeat protein
MRAVRHLACLMSGSGPARPGSMVFDVTREVVSPVLVGRRDDLDRLRGLLDLAAGGDPAVALLAGEAGVGKTRLVSEISGVAAERGFRVLSGGCAELGGEGLPLAPLVDILRTVTRATPEHDLDSCFGPARREFARLLPELDPEAAKAPPQEFSAGQLREHVLALITRLAASRPMLLVVEDLHWADRSTRELVAFLVQTIRELGVLLLLTYRSDELHRRHPLRPLVAAWERVRSVDRIEVGRFTRDEVAAQLQAIRRSVPTAQFTDVVYERSQGNAFLVEEIVAAVDAGADPGDIPPSLRDVLLARTETVSEPTQRILRTAAAAGPWVDDRLLEAVAGASAAELYPALREAVEHHLLVVDRTGRGFGFRHELTRDALYDDMLPGERVRLHAAYGEALAADPALLGDDGGVAATLAHHWYAALDLPRALTASVQAGRQAVAGFTPAEALRHLERALQIWPRVADATERTGMDWPRVSVLAAEAAWSTGELSRALSIMDQVLAVTDPAADPVASARLVERRAFVLQSLGRAAEAAASLQDALALLPAEPVTSTHAEVLASLANSLIRNGDEPRSAEVARIAADTAAAVGATAQQADALITLGTAVAYLDDGPAGLAALREGLALAERHDRQVVALRGYINLSDALEMLGRHAEAVAAATAGVELAVRVGHGRSYGAMLVGNLAEPLIRLGRWREALDLITEALADGPSGVFASTLLLLRGELHLWQGDLVAAEQDVQAARHQFGTGTDAQFTVPAVFIEAALAHARGDLADARRRILAELDRPETAFGVRYVWPLLWLGMRVEADAATAAAGGDPARLHELAATTPAANAPALAYRAMFGAEAARHTGAGVVAAWAAAVTATRAAGEAYPLCYSLFRLAEAQAGAESEATLKATVTECLALADDLAAATADEVRIVARRARLRLDATAPGPGQAQPDSRFRLTGREREVIALVAEGNSNGEIATALYISPKTASVHVSNILAKLGVSTRTEAAMVAHKLGLLPA